MIRPALLLSLLTLPAIACPTLPDPVVSLLDSQHHDTLLLGEMHGTNEAPQAAYATICHQASKLDQPLIVGLELNAEDLDFGGDLNRLKAQIQASTDWQTVFDGRSSRALYQLLERLHPLVKSGEIQVVGFNYKHDPRDLRMAENLRPYLGQPIVIYSGNWHTQTVHGNRWAPDAKMMGAYLKGWGANTLSIRLYSGNGTAWFWEEDGQKVYTLTNRQSAPAGTLKPASQERGYHYIWHLGPVTASLPQLKPAEGN
ncbi:hypothetical protein [Ferrimonas sp. YFM]|uniref:hypothetical protein n=1 Tax=Ferrimonas sp. YFM TaxID=3028878 RepID=UPI0025735AEF|nr:hypothetical protein [Ferrimonas sp. YFM]BDY06336.1 hypothetical protein F0521_33770 [Ferrimonas sp. YFM]